MSQGYQEKLVKREKREVWGLLGHQVIQETLACPEEMERLDFLGDLVKREKLELWVFLVLMEEKAILVCLVCQELQARLD